MNGEKAVPTHQQIADEFDMSSTGVYLLAKRKREQGDKRLDIYRNAWAFRLLCSFMTREESSRFDKIYPSSAELGRFFGVTKANINGLKQKRSPMYEVYIDAWNFKNTAISSMLKAVS